MAPRTRVILIGGSSHLGKSTLARALADRLGWDVQSTDRLARHPGRPWAPKPHALPPHVVEHYATLDDDALFASMLAHYRRVWSLAAELAFRHARDAAAPRLVLEGSALLPEGASELKAAEISAVWLTAEPELIASRIRAGSGYDAAGPQARALIDKFIARSQRFDRWLAAEVARAGLPELIVRPDVATAELAEDCLARLRPTSEL